MTTIDSIELSPSSRQTAFLPIGAASTLHDFAPAGWTDPVTTWTLPAADNEGSRITGLSSADIPLGTLRILHNMAGPGHARIDAAVLVLRHEDAGSQPENRIVCPAHRDFLVPPGASVIVQLMEHTYPTGVTERRWHVHSHGSREMHVEAHGFGLHPWLTLAAPAGEVDSWDPAPAVIHAGGTTYPSGLGIAGVSLDPIEASGWMLATPAAGATLNGMVWGSPWSQNTRWHGPIFHVWNDGPGALTLRHAASATHAHKLYCPNGRDVVIPAKSLVTLMHLPPGGYAVLPYSAQPSAVLDSLRVSKPVVQPWTTDSVPVSLVGGQTVSDWNPTGAIVGPNGKGMPTCSGARVSVASGVAVVESMIGPGTDGPNIPFELRLFGAGQLTLRHNVGTLGSRFLLPGNADVTLACGNRVHRLVYDSANHGRWMLV